MAEAATTDATKPQPGEPLWWVDNLSKQLATRARRIRKYDAYYEGDQKLAFSTRKFRQAFGRLFDDFADNWCGLVVDAVEERLNVEGFRLGTDQTKGDKDAWEIWQRNSLDAESVIAHTEALINETSYALVQPGKDDRARITIEHPLQMICAFDVEDRRERKAALKLWVDDEDGFGYATLYLPDEIYKYKSKNKPDGSGTTKWVRRDVADEAWPLPNPLKVVPVVPLQNRARLLKPPQSEIRSVISLQNAVNKTIADMLVASEFAAFRQRWAIGVDIPTDPDTKQPIEEFTAAVNRIWRSPNPNAKFGDFEATDLGPFVTAVEMLVQHIASQSRTPPHYFYLAGQQFPSGEALKSAEAGLISKTHRKTRFFGEDWEEIIRVAFKVQGDDKKASIMDSETLWRDPEYRTEGEHVDAVLKKQALGVPQEQLWEDLGYSPQQIERFKTMRAEEAALGIPKQPPPAPQTAPAMNGAGGQ